MEIDPDLLLPQPTSHLSGAPGLSLGPLEPEGAARISTPAVRRLERALARVNPGLALPLRLRIELVPGLAPEGYELDLRADGAYLRASEPAGAFYGTHRLAQMVELARAAGDLSLRLGTLRDRPHFPERGVSLDVSRDRIPTQAALFDLVDWLSSIGINQLQLYTEHTFAYAGHEEVWAGTGALTPEEIRELDRHCSERHVELVPNQQSFGHLHHWLMHPRYRSLAECPAGVLHPFSKTPEPFSLNPGDPRSLEFLGELYDELLPCFRSRRLNVGLDETFDLGRGASREACEEHGTGRVYLEFLKAVHGLCSERGHRMQFWADMLLNHRELVDEVPRDALPLLWGYEADHPFAREAERVAASGLQFLVCPGTSSWQSFAGRHGNMLANLQSAARQARSHDARGLLVTDWGDRGHLQPQVASYPGWVVAADLAWNPGARSERHEADGLAALLSQHVLGNRDGLAGQALMDFARVGEAVGAPVPNASPLSVLVTKAEQPFPPPELADLTVEGLERGGERLDQGRRSLARARFEGPEAEVLRGELEYAAALLDLGITLGRARLAAPGQPLDQLPRSARRHLLERLADLGVAHRSHWLARSRPGGRERSWAWLESVRDALGEPT